MWQVERRREEGRGGGKRGEEERRGICEDKEVEGGTMGEEKVR